MATSGSVDFDQSAISIIKDALILVHGIEDDGTPTAAQEQYAMRALNRLVKAWSHKPIKVWVWREATLALVANQQSYSLGPGGNLAIDRPLLIDSPRRVVSGVETAIRIASRQEYMTQPSKNSPGKPVYVYYDSQMDRGQLYVWPAPDAADQIKFSYKSYVQDFDSLADTPYFPSEWLDALVYNLALRLIPKYEVTGEDRAWITGQAEMLLQQAEDNDQDQGSIFLAPEMIR